jgi:hypothetical protein
MQPRSRSGAAASRQISSASASIRSARVSGRPQDDQVPADLTEELPQEHDHLVALDVVLVEVAVQGTLEPPGADGNAGDGGDPIVTLAMTHGWGCGRRDSRSCGPTG